MLNENIKNLRKKSGKTQDELAEILQITRQAYSAYETGRSVPPPDTIVRLADLFGVSTDYIFGLPEPNAENKNNYISIIGSNGSQMKIPVPPDKAERLKALIKAGLPELLEDDRFKDL